MSVKTSARLKKRRAGEQTWVSNNRVLAGSSSNKRTGNVGRNPNFDTDETKLLIQLWGDPKLQRTLITTHKKHAVICQLAAKMEEYGYHRSPEEITTRIKNLKCFYNRLKKEMDTGQATEPSWKHFAEMDAIMTRPIFSVRPNEVPAPSLKYQLEQAREEREERRKKMQEEGADLSESDTDDDIFVASLIAKKPTATGSSTTTKHDSDDGIIPDVEVDMDISEETFAALTNVAKTTTARTAKRRKLAKVRSDTAATSTAAVSDEAEDVDIDGDDADIKDEPTTSHENSSGTHEDELLESCKNKLNEQKSEINNVGSTKNAEANKNKNNNNNNNSHSKNNNANVNSSSNNNNNKNNITANNNANNSVITTTNATTTNNNSNGNKDMCAALIIPKEEPIDVDSDSDEPVNTNVRALMPTLADILQMSKSGSLALTNANNVCIPVSSMTAISAPKTLATFTASAQAATTTAATTTVTTQPQQGKISLVPTNFLMQQPKPTATIAATAATTTTTRTITMKQAKPPIQLQPTTNKATLPQRFMLSGTPQMATGSGGVKLLLLNTEATTTTAAAVGAGNNKTVLDQINASVLNTGAVLPVGSTLQCVPASQQQKPAYEAQQKYEQETHKRKQPQEKANDDLMTKRDATSLRILLRQLLNAQNECNEIQHNRLSLERERLDWEKAMGERLLQLLPALLQPQQTTNAGNAAAINQQTPQQQQIQSQSQSQQQQFIAAQVSSQAQRMNPPKLVFATALAAANGGSVQHILTPTATLTTSLPKMNANNCAVTTAGAAVTATSAVATATGLKSVEICTQINDIQLVTPKIEQED